MNVQKRKVYVVQMYINKFFLWQFSAICNHSFKNCCAI